MPIYEYKCAGCSNIFEELVMGSVNKAPEKCPECGGSDIERVSSSFAAVVSCANSAPPCGSSQECGIGGDTSPKSACGCCCGGTHHNH